jgi:leucyl aminopeptidase (aminopeptidase T)
MPQTAALVDQALRAAGVPIVSVVIGVDGDRATWTITFDPSATSAQRAQAATLLATVGVDAAAQLDDRAIADMDAKDLKATMLALWEAIPGPLLTRAQVRARAIAIRKTL